MTVRTPPASKPSRIALLSTLAALIALASCGGNADIDDSQSPWWEVRCPKGTSMIGLSYKDGPVALASDLAEAVTVICR